MAPHATHLIIDSALIHDEDINLDYAQFKVSKGPNNRGVRTESAKKIFRYGNGEIKSRFNLIFRISKELDMQRTRDSR